MEQRNDFPMINGASRENNDRKTCQDPQMGNILYRNAGKVHVHETRVNVASFSFSAYFCLARGVAYFRQRFFYQKKEKKSFQKFV